MRLLGIICDRGFNSNIYEYMPIIQRIYLPAILLAVFVLYVYGEKTSYWWILKEAVADINDIKVIGARPFQLESWHIMTICIIYELMRYFIYLLQRLKELSRKK